MIHIDAPRWQRWHGLSGHLISTAGLDELHSFAEQITLPKRFFMGGALVPHYQLPAVLRDRALSAGATELAGYLWERALTAALRASQPAKPLRASVRQPQRVFDF